MRLLEYLAARARRERELKESPKEERSGFSIMDLILPRPTRAFLIRLALLVAVAWAVFKWLCLPMYLDGDSMAPAYRSGTFNFCWTPAYWRSPPRQGDVVIVKYAGKRLMLLKRVVALEGETAEFRGGRLFIDGKESLEPYVKGPCDWQMTPRRVAAGCVFVVGDNRSMSIETHKFGEVEMNRIAGAPLW